MQRSLVKKGNIVLLPLFNCVCASHLTKFRNEGGLNVTFLKIRTSAASCCLKNASFLVRYH